VQADMPYHRKRMVIEILEGLFKQPPIAATATPAPPGIEDLGSSSLRTGIQ